VSARFDARKNLVVVRAEISGPKGIAVLPLALDTGATKTLISFEALMSIGYEPAHASESVKVITADSIVEIPVIALKMIRCLGQVRRRFSVMSHDLPHTAAVAGLLGLDFLRDRVLTINFPKAEVRLTQPRRPPTKRRAMHRRKPAQ
jgi:hypothetical protein